METVSFTRMDQGTAADYELLSHLEAEEIKRFPEQVLGWLIAMDEPTGYQITRLKHSLQSATRAHRDGRPDEYVLMCLLHDIGDVLAPANHSEAAAALLKPYVSEDLYWIVKHHGVFQGFYYFQHLGQDPNARDIYRDHPLFDATVEFCEKYDQNCFDPDYDTLPLEAFERLVYEGLSQPKGFV